MQTVNQVLFYEIFFIISMIVSGLYVFRWHKHFSVYFNLIFMIIPLTDLGYVFLAKSTNLQEALVANKVIYIGGCFNILFVTLSIFKLCHYTISNLNRLILFTVSSLNYFMALTMGSEIKIFYENVEFATSPSGAGMLVNKVYGFGHTIFYITIILYCMLSFAALLYSAVKKKSVSRYIVHRLFVAEIVTVYTFFGGRLITDEIDMVPIGYLISEILFLFIINRICLYDISESGIDSVLEKGNTGFISVDLKLNYLGSNMTARSIFPELNDLIVDRSITMSEKFYGKIKDSLDAFIKNDKKDKFHYEKGNKVYLIDINHLVDGRKKRGYQLVITDDTKDQRYISLLSKFNSSLQDQVNRKTNYLNEMHNNLIMSMAAMVESRDNSTGGHIKRTSQGVRILVNEIKASNTFKLSDDFCKDIIKAAPMHDLGKIAVDDVILRKPGKFEPEEFEIMKKHAAEGARIVREILKNTDDVDFRIIAENVAHYHHERWDGSGYPDGLKGDKIPIEARIMAIADVYDALVSKRVYKDSMSFEKADSIIMESFGKHFDERLKCCYENARPKLEEYYMSIEKES